MPRTRKAGRPAKERTQQVAVRLPLTLLGRIDRHSQRLERQTGLSVTRAQTIAALLRQALNAAESSEDEEDT